MPLGGCAVARQAERGGTGAPGDGQRLPRYADSVVIAPPAVVIFANNRPYWRYTASDKDVPAAGHRRARNQPILTGAYAVLEGFPEETPARVGTREIFDQSMALNCGLC